MSSGLGGAVMSFLTSVGDHITEFLKTLGAKVQQFMAPPGGAIVKQAATREDWGRISASLQLRGFVPFSRAGPR